MDRADLFIAGTPSHVQASAASSRMGTDRRKCPAKLCQLGSHKSLAFSGLSPICLACKGGYSPANYGRALIVARRMWEVPRVAGLKAQHTMNDLRHD